VAPARRDARITSFVALISAELSTWVDSAGDDGDFLTFNESTLGIQIFKRTLWYGALAFAEASSVESDVDVVEDGGSDQPTLAIFVMLDDRS
jgi:hypothetical protein